MTGKSEKAILNEALVAVSALPRTLVYRNNSGAAWQGKQVEARIGEMIRVEPGMMILRDARPVRFGLTGSGDIMGVVDGQAASIEIKDATGKQSTEQHNFERAWTKAGGIYVLARSSEDAIAPFTS